MNGQDFSDPNMEASEALDASNRLYDLSDIFSEVCERREARRHAIRAAMRFMDPSASEVFNFERFGAFSVRQRRDLSAGR